MREDLKHCKYTMFHPLNGFEEVKWNGKGSYRISAVVVFLLLRVKVFSAQMTGFCCNTHKPAKI